MHLEHPEYSDQTIATKLGLTRSSVWRITSKIEEYSIIDTTGWTEAELQIYEEYKMRKEIKKKETTKNKIIRVFTLRRTNADQRPEGLESEYSMGDAMQHRTNFLDNYIPQTNIQPLDVTLENNQIKEQAPFVGGVHRNGQPVFPKFFINPLNALDMIVLQDVYVHTICGSIIDVLVAFTMGQGIRPVLKLNSENIEDIKKIKIQKNDETEASTAAIEGEVEEPEEEPEKPVEKTKEETKEELMAKVLEENEWLLDPIKAIDDSFSDPKQLDPFLDENWNDKVEAVIRNHWIYGRSMMTYEYFPEKTFVWNNKKFPTIPNIIKIIHTRDMGFVQIDQATQKLEGVNLMFSTGMILAENMLYLEHTKNSPIYNGKFYGYSKMMRMLGDGRSLRKLKDRDFPNVASIGYSGFSIIAFRADTKGAVEEQNQNTGFVNSLTIGSPNATTLKDPEHDMKVHNVDTDAKIAEMIEMAHYHAEAAAKSAQVPTALVSKEKDPNRDTLLGILRLFKENEVKNLQAKIGKTFDAQYYMPNFRTIYKDNPDVLKNFHVESEFIDVKLESWDDLVDATKVLESLGRLKAEARGEMLGIKNYESKLDPDAPPIDQSSTVTDDDGKKITTTTSSPGKPKEPKKQQTDEKTD